MTKGFQDLAQFLYDEFYNINLSIEEAFKTYWYHEVEVHFSGLRDKVDLLPVLLEFVQASQIGYRV